MNHSDLGACIAAPVAAAPLTLAIGISRRDLPARAGHGGRVACLPYRLLPAALEAAPLTECIVIPLVGDRFDAVDVARVLARAGYRGALLVVLPPVPRPEIIRRELRQICAGVAIELVAKAPH